MPGEITDHRSKCLDVVNLRHWQGSEQLREHRNFKEYANVSIPVTLVRVHHKCFDYLTSFLHERTL